MSEPATVPPADKSMDELVALCKRRGFIFPASEVYGGINGFWDYGPLGTDLKNNLRDAWWNDLVRSPPAGPDGQPLSLVGLDSSIIQNPRVWEASGHVGGFNDPMQTCRQCKKLFRADHVPDMLSESDWPKAAADAAGVDPAGTELTPDVDGLRKWAQRKAKKVAPGLALVRDPDNVLTAMGSSLGSFAGLLAALATPPGEEAATPCPACGGDLTAPRQFNLMFETFVGAVRNEDARAYLRPETAQGIFLNYRNVLDTMRVKVPFGIAQIGKAFRNEVTPRNFIFRSREFEQMEVEWFCHPNDAQTWYEFWCAHRREWWQGLGLSAENLYLRSHDADELAHYAKDGCGTYDIEYRFPFTAPGYGELEGVAHRSDFDLRQHQEHSGTKMEYFDQERNERYIPHVIEPSAGLSRGVLALLCEAFTPDPERPSKVYMRFHPRVAPIQAAVFPLVNKDGMPEVAAKLYNDLRGTWKTQLDVKQTIGKRYARMDEAGTPFCFTIDGDTLQDQTVTVRHRDSLQQERIGIDRVREFLTERL
ncbi:MAG: glycine--tRNA ligase [Planctomycetota bacterium]